MKIYVLLGLLAGMLLLGTAIPATAETVPEVATVTPFTPQARYMSLTGYLRWQYYQSNKEWISRAQANQMVLAQIQGRSPTLIAQVRREA